MVAKDTKVPRTVFLTEKEQKSVDAIIGAGNYAEAAKSLGCPGGSLRSTMFRIRLRYDNALRFIRELDELQKRLPRKKRYITG